MVRSSAAAETLAFPGAFDDAFLLNHDLQRIMGHSIPILMLTEFEQLLNFLTHCRYTTERRRVFHISAVREAYQDGHVSHVGLIAVKQFLQCKGVLEVD